jgi:hypothetical protein
MTDSLTEALCAVQADLPKIKKADKADTGKFSYTYASLTDVNDAILPLLAKHGLAFACCPTVDSQGFVLRWELRHTSGETLEGSWPLPDSGGAQAQGSAVTYGRRYCLLAVTGAAPDDDDDGAAATVQATRPVDLTVLNELIDVAVDAGIEKDWDALRKYARQSDGHRDKACDKVSRALEQVPA